MTIKNGTIRDFDGVGIYEFAVSNNRIAHVSITGTADGVNLHACSTTEVDHVSVTSNQFVGFVISHSHDITVLASAAGSAPASTGSCSVTPATR